MLNLLRQYISRYIMLTDEEFEMLAEKLEVRSFEKKKQLIVAGETEFYLNFLVSGLARKYFMRGREEVITQIAKETDLISSSVSFITGEPSTYFVETIEASSFISIRKEHIEELYKKSHRFEHLGRLIITNLFLQKEYWDYDLMRLSTRERFVQFLRNNPDLLQRVPQKFLASYLNIKPETFSRLKHLLRKKKT
jgi:CRP-like cAMP-binding protein